MKEDETIIVFIIMLKDISNEFYNLGEKTYEEKIVRKILRSLRKRFNYKVDAVEETARPNLLEKECNATLSHEDNKKHKNGIAKFVAFTTKVVEFVCMSDES
ncbi:hypothetical protein LIER_35113 [Lithospermum erythrorhizon]|uniref:Gag-pol polyprotein n=1 Tax=Lithospermum erythrorhizon TaxID=34254 RepID=A0AAV3NJV6_LITER